MLIGERAHSPDPPITGGNHVDTPDMEDTDLLQMARALTTQHNSVRVKRLSEIKRSYRAYRSKHFEGSKYEHARYRSRAKYFVPKTRAAVRKNMVAAATALFQSHDAVHVGAEDGSDKLAVASAATWNEILNFRLTTDRPDHSLNWFEIAMGARLDSILTGLCVSKQSWVYRYEDAEPVDDGIDDEPETEDAFDEGRIPEMEMDGEAEAPEPETIVAEDRPQIELFPLEDVFLDAAGPWFARAQNSSYLMLRYPMTVGDVRARIAGRMGSEGEPWKEISDQVLRMSHADYTIDIGVRSAREGVDRYRDAEMPQIDDLSTVYVYEVFIRRDGVDWCFLTAGNHSMLTRPRPTSQVYPWAKGHRPVVIGCAEIESHTALPESPVEHWQPLQQELNDLRNLKIDAIKQSVSPITLYRRGRQVDLRSLQARGPDATIGVDNMEDVDFRAIPSPSAGIFQETAHINTDMDELSGSFSGSSVQNNRSLNETVGGMQLLSGSAGGATEYDLMVWVKTWVAPVLTQVLALEQHYESNPRILEIAARKARQFEEEGFQPTPEQLASADVFVTVAVGNGAVDPMMRQAKLSNTLALTAKALEHPAMLAQAKPKAKPILDEIWGLGGYSDASRFFEMGAGGQPADPNAAENNLEAMKLQLDERRLQLEELKAQQDWMKAQLDAQVEREGDQLSAQTTLMAKRMDLMGRRMESEDRALESEKQRLNEYFRPEAPKPSKPNGRATA